MTRLAVLALCLLAALAAAAPASAQRPDITAPSAIVVDATTGEVVYDRAADERRPIASATKLMTALLVLERERLSRVVPAARYRALAVESKLGLREGERMTVADLLRGLLIASANDAAATLAEAVSGSIPAFVRDMNARAAELGLGDTSFANPIGLDSPSNYSTAADLAVLARELREHEFFRDVVDTPQTTLRSGARRRTISNRNRLVRDLPWIDGVKTGHTQGAGYVLIGSGEKRGVRLISVALGTPSESARETDTVKLLDWGFRRYRRFTAVERGDVMALVPIRYRAGASLKLMAARTLRTTARSRPEFDLRRVGLPEEVEGPVREGQQFGMLEAWLDGRRIGRTALVATTSLAEAGPARRAQDWFTRPSSLLILGVAAVALTLLLTAGPRPRRRHEGPPADAGQAGEAGPA